MEEVLVNLYILVIGHVADWHSTLANQRKSPLLRFPPELRNRIYEYVCCSLIVTVRPGQKKSAIAPRNTFLATCRQFYYEFMAIFLTRATFDISSALFEMGRINHVKPLHSIKCTQLDFDKAHVIAAYGLVWNKGDWPRIMSGVKRLYVRHEQNDLRGLNINVFKGNILSCFGNSNMQVIFTKV